MYLDYSAPSQLSRVYVPPGLFNSSAASNLRLGGTFSNDIGSDLVFSGQEYISIQNTTFKSPAGFFVQGYIAAGQWQPIPGGNISPTKTYYYTNTDNSLTISGLSLANINGANTAIKPASGLLSNYLATVTLYYIPI
jgi:hypothetical protein